MRVSIVSILLTGGMLALGACSTAREPINLTLAEQEQICHGVSRVQIIPTGRQTGDIRKDYECRAIHGLGYLDRGERGIVGAGAARSAAIDRSLRTGR